MINTNNLFLWTLLTLLIVKVQDINSKEICICKGPLLYLNWRHIQHHCQYHTSLIRWWHPDKACNRYETLTIFQNVSELSINARKQSIVFSRISIETPNLFPVIFNDTPINYSDKDNKCLWARTLADVITGELNKSTLQCLQKAFNSIFIFIPTPPKCDPMPDIMPVKTGMFSSYSIPLQTIYIVYIQGILFSIFISDVIF